MIALANYQRGDWVGEVNEKIYCKFNIGKQNAFYRDIVDGDNGFYGAGAGYYLVTGLGTPRMAKMI